MSDLLLVRHGETEMGRERRCCGHSDVPLTPEGVMQAQRLKERLESEKIDLVYSSDLQRCVTTARTIAAPHGLEVVSYPQLREIDFGGFEGLNFAEISRLYPEEARQWIQQPTTAMRLPRGESFQELAARVGQFCQHLREHAPDTRILVVGHSGPLRLILCLALGLGLETWWHLHLQNASLSVVECYPQKPALSLLNDLCHLEGL